MYIIGISAYYHDSSICLFKNEELIFAIEEEKFTGIKHDASFPHKSLEYIIDKYKIKRDEIDMICYYEDPKLKRKRVILNGIINFFKSPVKSIKSFSKINSNLKDLTQQLKKYSDNIFILSIINHTFITLTHIQTMTKVFVLVLMVLGNSIQLP